MDKLKELFSPECDYATSKEKCKHLAAQPILALELEKIQVSEHSPSLVLDDENIARQIFSPIHYDNDNGSIKPSAFDDVSSKGMSVNREQYITSEEIHCAALKKEYADNERSLSTGGQARSYIGFASASVKDIRSFIDEQQRVFAVYDSSLVDFIPHADVCMIYQDTNQPAGKKWVKNYRRKKLQELFSTVILIAK
ncbi:hypothetical protein PU783_000611 [Cronobacter sakazakii]|uniref:hypothetical protein n=1 Tax=Cronobacter malonaticus TaxID=413503 RepID=UPI0014109BBE|nr:hypothetical protein [Cronobacter malonaticus]EKM1389179.1 hypothetical protein [Cronobacter sakazakii]EKM6438478.1 hypothetical protein [Cronobacter sakazakii]KAB1063628.1 hypothetical protein AUN10_06140 [Cronobacter sakazakii]MDT3560217.1 hypothetical protein [Cronobacter malonaticus]